MDVRDALCLRGPLDGESRPASIDARVERLWIAQRAEDEPLTGKLVECTRLPSVPAQALWRCVGVYELLSTGPVRVWRWRALAGWPVLQNSVA